MLNRQKIYIALAVSAGVCSSIALLLYLRHRRQTALPKTSKKSRNDRQYTDITSADINNDKSESVRFQSGGATIEVEVPGGCISLTAEQAIVLTRFLDESNNDIERLHRILTNIANSATFSESQINLANAGCINRLREILLITNNETTKHKILLALNNLALNECTITHFTGLVSIVINLYRTSPSNSPVRLSSLNLLINMSVLEYLHDEYMKDLNEFNLLIQSAFDNNDERLSMGKILVNLSTNKLNLENLLKITGIELNTIVNICKPMKRNIDNEESTKLEEMLLRYVSFYRNLAEIIIKELQHKSDDMNHNKPWLIEAKLYQEGAVYFELFSHDKQMLAKSILRPQYASNIINAQIKRLRLSMDTIRQIQFESSVLSVHDEFNDDDHNSTISDFSTPKKLPESTLIIDNDNIENKFECLEKDVNEQFDDDDTILANSFAPSDQSLTSFCSAYSTIEDNNFTSLERSMSN